MNRKDAQRKRDKAIKQLRALGMSDDEIANELGVESIALKQESEIIDAEIVDLSNDSPMDEPLPHLPAIIPQPLADSSESIGRDWSKSPVPERRCKAHKKTGEQCKNAAIQGGTVCRYHGGAAKYVKQAARARIDNAQDRLAQELLGMAIDPDLTPAVKLTAIRDALDRGGLKAPNEIVISAGSQTGFDEVFDGIYSGPMVRDDSSSPIEPQSDSPFVVDCPPATAMPAGDASSALGYEHERPYTGPADRERYERRERRQTQRASRQNGSAPVTGYDAMHAANELRALPPGQG